MNNFKNCTDRNRTKINYKIAIKSAILHRYKNPYAKRKYKMLIAEN